MNLNTEDLRENGESVVLDKQENFSIEQNDNQLIKHTQTIVVERFHYSKEDDNNNNKPRKKENTKTEKRNEKCSEIVSEHLYKLDDAEILLNKLANVVSYEMQKLKSLRNRMICVENKEDQEDKLYDKTWDQNLSFANAINFRKNTKNQYRPNIASYLDTPNSVKEKSTAATFSNNRPSIDLNSNPPINKPTRNYANRYSNKKSLYDRPNLQENSSSRKQKNRKNYNLQNTRDEPLQQKRPISSSVRNAEVNDNKFYQKGSKQNRDYKKQKPPLAVDEQSPGDAKKCLNNNICNCRPDVGPIVPPLVDYNCYCSEYDYQNYINNCWDSGCCCCCCYPANMFDEVLLNTSPEATPTCVVEENTETMKVNDLSEKQYVDDFDEPVIEDCEDSPTNLSISSDDETDDECSEESTSQQIFYRTEEVANLEANDICQQSEDKNVQTCTCCCCNQLNGYEYDSLNNGQRKEHVEKTMSTRNDNNLVPERKSKAPKKGRHNSVNGRNSQWAKKENKNTKNNRNIPLKKRENNASPKKGSPPSGTNEKKQKVVGSQRNSTKKKVTQKHKPIIDKVSPEMDYTINLDSLNDYRSQVIDVNNECCKNCCSKGKNDTSNYLESGKLKLNELYENKTDDDEDIYSDDSSYTDGYVFTESDKNFPDALRNVEFRCGCCCCCACKKNKPNEDKRKITESLLQPEYKYDKMERERKLQKEENEYRNQMKDSHQKNVFEQPATNRIQCGKCCCCYCCCCCCCHNINNVVNDNVEGRKHVEPADLSQQRITPLERKNYNNIRNENEQLKSVGMHSIEKSSQFNRNKVRKDARAINEVSNKNKSAIPEFIRKSTSPTDAQIKKYKKREETDKPKANQRPKNNESNSLTEHHWHNAKPYPVQFCCKCCCCCTNNAHVGYQNPYTTHIETNKEAIYNECKDYYPNYGNFNKNVYNSQEPNFNDATNVKRKKDSDSDSDNDKCFDNDQMYSVNKYKLKNEKTLMQKSKKTKNLNEDNSFDSEFLLETLNTFKNMRPYRHSDKVRKSKTP